ncbi:MAG: YerC/YecD family TrpR-related protein [Clostridia bacterium]
MFTPRVQTEQTELLMRALLQLDSIEEAYRFCEDVLTVQELKSITQRLEVAVMLRKKITYQEIAHKTGASTATISRVNRALLYGANGYNLVLDTLSQDANVQQK